MRALRAFAAVVAVPAAVVVAASFGLAAVLHSGWASLLPGPPCALVARHVARLARCTAAHLCPIGYGK